MRAAHLGALGEDFARHRRYEGPWSRETVVVPSSSVSGWLERFLADPTRGSSSGVVAQLFTVYWPRVIAHALYDSPDEYDAWTARSLGLSLLRRGRLDVTSARRRGERLAAWVAYRGDVLDDLVAYPGCEEERHVLDERREIGLLTPFQAFADNRCRPRGPLEHGFDVFAAPDSPVGDLGWSVVSTLAREVEVGVYLLDPAPEDHPHTFEPHWRWATRRRDFLVRCSNLLSEESEWVGPVPCTPRVEVHATVGESREVDAARDAVWSALGDDSLSLEQVRVVVLDSQKFGPLVETTFRPSDESAPSITYERADGGPDARSERMDALRALVDLVSSDLTLDDVLGCVAHQRLGRGLGFTDDDVARLEQLALEGWVTMGWDSLTRAETGVYELGDDAGTWSRWIDRVALASVLDGSGEWEGLHPLGSPADLELVAQLREFFDALATYAEFVSRSHSLDEWVGWLITVLRWIPTDSDSRDDAPDRLLRELRAASAWLDGDVPFSIVRDVVEWFDTSAQWRTLYDRGGVHIVDPFSVAGAPYNVTVVVGADDNAVRTSEGLLATTSPRPDDPDSREELRTALAELVASTSTRLVVTTSSRSVIDGGPQPWSSLVEDLRSTSVLVEHPRHFYSSTAVVSGLDFAATAEPDRFQTDAHDIARSLRQPPSTWWWSEYRFSEVSDESHDIVLEDLISYLRSPQRIFARDVLAGARLAESKEKRRTVPPWLIDDPLDRHVVLQRAFDQELAENHGRDLVGPDTSVGGIVEPFRDLAIRHARVEGARSLARLTRDGLHALEGLPHPHARAGRVSVDHRDLVRGELGLVETPSGAFAYAPFLRKVLGDGVISLAVWSCMLTWELGVPTPVIGLCLGAPPKVTKGKEGPTWGHTLTWVIPPSLEVAQEAVREWITLYDSRYDRLPDFFPRPALAEEPTLPSGLTSAAGEWSSGWASKDAPPRDGFSYLLVGEMEYSDVVDAEGGRVRRRQSAFVSLLTRLKWTTVPKGVPWWDVVPW